MRLGIRQLELLRTLSTRLVLVIGGKRTARLCALGLCEADADGHMVRITNAGMRALVDAVDAGSLPLFEVSHAEMVANLRRDKETP